MAVVVETTIGDFTIDLFIEERPQTCKNFLKLCKIKYYNFCLFHSIQPNFLAQTGDPSGLGTGGESVFGIVYGENARYYEGEKMPKIKHTKPGLLSMVNCGNNMLGSQFFVTLGSELQSLDEHCVFAEIAEGMDILLKLNETICDAQHRPYQDIRITHTVILHDPFEDLSGLVIPDVSPEHSQQALDNGRIGADEEIDDTAGLTSIEVEEMKKDREAKARATILEIVGDLPDAEMAPPENVLFVCKLNPVTNDDDLEIIFSRFGKVKSCEVIRDQETGDSLQYAFVEFEDKKACEEAYFKMDNVLIDDRRIHVDFSQSVAKMRWRGKGRGVDYFDKGNRRDSDKQHQKDDSRKESKPDSKNSDSRRKEDKRYVRREEKYDTNRQSKNKDLEIRKSDDRRRKETGKQEEYGGRKLDDRRRRKIVNQEDFDDKKFDDRRRREMDNQEHSSRNSKDFRAEKREMRVDDNSRSRYPLKNDEMRVRRGDERQNYHQQFVKDPVTGNVWGEPFRVVGPQIPTIRKVWEEPFRAMDTRRNDYQKKEYDSGNHRLKVRYDRGEQIRPNENFKHDSFSTDRFRYEEKVERRVEIFEAGHSRNGLEKNGHQSSRVTRVRDSSTPRTSSALSANRSRTEHGPDEIPSPLVGSSAQNNSVVNEQNTTLRSPGADEKVKTKDKKAKKRKNEDEKTAKLKKKKKYSSSSNSDSSASSASSDSDSSSSDSDSTTRKRKGKVRTTIAKKYYHKGKLVKIVKKKKDSSTDSDTDDSSDSDQKKKKHRRKGRAKKIVKIIEKKKKRKHDSSSDDSESSSSSSSSASSSSSSEESDSDSDHQKKKRKLDAKKKQKKNMKEKSEKKKKKVKKDSRPNEEIEEDKNSLKMKKSTN